MKKLLQLATISSTIMLSGCSTLVTPAQTLQQGLPSADQQQLNTVLNTAKDNQPQVWHTDNGDTLYQLTTTNTRVNDQGQPCRDYALLVDRKYHRKQTTTATVCRDNGQWLVSN